jgi:hypothetical protein
MLVRVMVIAAGTPGGAYQAFDLKGAAAKRRWQQLAALLTPNGRDPDWRRRPRSWISSAAGTANPAAQGKPTAAI